MIPYILFGLFLWIVMLVTSERPTNRGWSFICLAAMIVFTGLRYEIGYDWLAYEQYYLWVGDSFSWSSYQLSQTVLPVEYLYFVLNVLVYNVGGTIETLLFVIAVFNLVTIDRIANSIDPSSRPFVWLMYLCIALIMIQFNIIRQGIASSFVLISLLLACRKKYAYALPTGLCALGFHTSTAIFLPIFPFIHREIKFRYVIAIIAISAVIFVAGNTFLASTLNAIGNLLPGGISQKTDLYATGIADGNVWGISPLAGALIVFYCVLLSIFQKCPKNPFVNVAILLTIAVLFAHVAFGQVPIIWNRVMCVSLPWQLAVLWRYFIRELSPGNRKVAVAGGGMAAILVFGFQLTRPENIAFVPYHSLVQVWLFNDKGDGRERSMYAVQQGQIEATRRASR